MKRFRNLRMPSPAMLIAVIAVVLALTGSAFAAKKLSLGALSDSAKNKTVGVGKLTYVSTPVSVPQTTGQNLRQVTANCPSGLRPIGGGIKLEPDDPNIWVDDSYLTATGYKGAVFNGEPDPATATVVVACANSRAVTGTPPTS